MLRYFRKKNGQVIGEYALGLVVVVAALTAMAVYMRRGLQARVYDGKTFMVDTINHASDILGAENVDVPQEYEPYYGQSDSTADTTSTEEVEMVEGGTTGIFRKTVDTTSLNRATTRQLPPREAR